MTDDKTLPTDPEDDDKTLTDFGPKAGEIGTDAEIGVTIGPYRLVSRLGEGGMGEVFAADQTEPIKRRVALKVIKPGMDSRAVVARFEAERQALALMDHPCIARVIEAGATKRGRPFFVMEYVNGIPITKYCDQHRLDMKQRLELMIQVCEGVQHAHQKAVIHRDLKPSNILVTEVDGRPVPKIIDFGVAKAVEQPLTDSTMHTVLGQLVGTPEYMSPEQAAATGTDIDTRTDVYALGVVMYELLSGALPFSGAELRKAGLAEIQRIICEEEPPRPSTRFTSLGDEATAVAEHRHQAPRQLAQSLRGDLDWITMKALAKERDRRYDTANGLAMDMRRFLNNEPVLASPPSPTYRLGKLVRRNRGVVVSLISFMAILTMATVVSLSMYFRAERESARARTEAAKSAEVSGFLKEMLAGVGPAAARGRDTAMLQEILAETETRLSRELGDQPEVEAALREVLATTSMDLGQYETSLLQARQNIELNRSLFGPTDHRTATAVALVGKITMFQGDFARSDSLLSWADAQVSEQLGSGSLKALEIRTWRIENLSFAGQLDLASNLADDILELKDGTELWGDDVTHMTLYLLAQIRAEQQRYVEADSLHTLVIPMLIAELGPDHPNTMSARVSHGLTLTYAGRLEEAERITLATMADLRRVVGNEHPQTQTAMNNLAITYNRMEQPEKAEALYRQMLEISERTMGPLHPEHLAGVVNFSTFMRRNGRCKESIEVADAALEGFHKGVGDDFIGCGYALRNRASCLRELGRNVEAAVDFAECHRIFTLIYGVEDLRASDTAEQLTLIHEELGNSDEADKWRELI